MTDGTNCILRLLENQAAWEICGEANTNPDTAIGLFSFHDLPEVESIAKAGVHGEASKNLSSLIRAIARALNSSADRLSAAGDGITAPARPQPEGVL